MYSTQSALTNTEFSAAAISRQAELTEDSAPRLRVIGRRALSRPDTESYIAQKFASSYGATLREFLPYLLELRTASGLGGALGMRRAAPGQTLFLERYLDEPAEGILGDLLASPVERGSMVEIGNLVATWRGSSQMLFIALAALIVQVGAEWAVFTATPEVQKLLARLGVKQYVLGKAEGSKLGEQLADWGSYYRSSPSLVAVNAVHALNIFARQPMTSMLLASCKYQITSSCSANNIGSLYE
tara:strand:- start:366 stop:1094 length:729 start_codon:yes stop_codon:yes gene_type:complete